MKIKSKKFFTGALILIGAGLFAQSNKSVGIGTLTPNQSAVLDLESNNQGFMMPHLTNLQITSITTPMNGLIVYSTTDSCYWFYKANYWDKICGTQHIISNYINTDTLIANTVTINTINADSIISNYINTHYIHSDTVIASYGNITYLITDTFISNQATINDLNTDTIFSNYIHSNTISTNTITAGVGSFDTLLVNGQSINNVITNEIDTTAWLLDGNSGTNAAINFLGTKDSVDLVFRTNNRERVRIKADGGNVGINTSAPTNDLDVNGGIRMRPGAAPNYVMLSDAIGNGTWENPVGTVITPGNLNGTAWDLIGNTGTNPIINFLGTSDSLDVVFKTNNRERIRILANAGFVGINTPSPTNDLDINGGIRIRPGANLNYVLLSDANGNGTWQNPLTTILTYTTIGNYAWGLLGNTGTNPTINFMGTKDSNDVVFKTDNRERMRIIANGGFVGINTNLPTNTLDINGQFRMRGGLPATNKIIVSSNANGDARWADGDSLFWKLGGNSGTNPTINFIGTTDNNNLFVRTNSVNCFQFNTAGQLRAVLNGSQALPAYGFWADDHSGMWFNTVDNSVNIATPAYAFITGFPSMSLGVNINMVPRSSLAWTGGGPITGITNTISVNESADVVIGQLNNLNNSGAVGNFVYGNQNSISGSSQNYIMGYVNVITGATNGCEIIGFHNNISATSNFSSIIGNNNIVNISGGAYNYILGGDWNIIHSSASAFGYGSGLSSFAPSSTQIMGAGGTKVYSNAAGTTGVSLAPGGGAWASISDRKLKENITEINKSSLLDKFLSVPVTEWNYITQPVDTMNKYAPIGIHYDKSPLHIGPMAQDFATVFGYGEYTDKITSSDIDGVMFIAIQALAEKQKNVEELTLTVSGFKKQLEEMKVVIEELKKK